MSSSLIYDIGYCNDVRVYSSKMRVNVYRFVSIFAGKYHKYYTLTVSAQLFIAEDLEQQIRCRIQTHLMNRWDTLLVTLLRHFG